MCIAPWQRGSPTKEKITFILDGQAPSIFYHKSRAALSDPPTMKRKWKPIINGRPGLQVKLGNMFAERLGIYVLVKHLYNLDPHHHQRGVAFER